MDTRWKMSKFAGLPSWFVGFAKRLGLVYKPGKKVLVDRDGEPVAWLLEPNEKRDKINCMVGIEKSVAYLWHSEHPVACTLTELNRIKTREDLLTFQTLPLSSDNSPVVSVDIQELAEDSKKRSQYRAALDPEAIQLGMGRSSIDPLSLKVDKLPDVEDALKTLGTVGEEDMLKNVQGQRIFVDVFENIHRISEEDVHNPDPKRNRKKSRRN